MSLRNITDNQKKLLYQKLNKKCQYCGIELLGYWKEHSPLSKSGEFGKFYFTIENGIIHHILFLELGGLDIEENRTIACINCHKHIHSHFYYKKEILLPLNSLPIGVNNA
jgi:5-methylcytosine-specific restriction endonuclease McrA